MAIPQIVMAVAAVVGAIVSAVGAAIAEGDFQKARELREKAASEYGDEVLPQIDRALKQEVGESAFASIVTDEAPRSQQNAAMRRLSELSEADGHGAGDEAALQLANQGAQQAAASDYQSMQQLLAARGQQNNPALMAAMRANLGGSVVQATATNRYRAQADGRDRAMRALDMSSNIASNMRGQDWAQSSGRASALDRRSEFNAGMAMDVNNENFRRDQARFHNRLDLKGRRVDANDRVAGGLEQKGQNTRSVAAGIGNSVTSAGAAVAGGIQRSEDSATALEIARIRAGGK